MIRDRRWLACAGAVLLALGSCGPDRMIGTVCRAADPANPCDADDLYVFDEQTRSRSCPAKGGNAGTVCRASAGPCDPAEECTGTSEACPADGIYNSTIVCSTGSRCTSTERCTGDSPACPTPRLLAAGTSCREVPFERRECDLPDFCDAAGNCPDRVEPAGKACTTAICTGSSTCPLNYNRCCNQAAGTCSTVGSCSATCNCSIQPC